MGHLAIRGAALYAVFSAVMFAQQVKLRPAPTVQFPSEVDSNSPALWIGEDLVVYNSTGNGPVRSTGANQFRLERSQPVVLGPSIHWPYWIEATWADDDGTIFAWYHWEPQNLCRNSRLTAPKIGALVSRDGGKSFSDLGIILESGYSIDCSSQNGYFGGGHGDFSVLLSRNRSHFYFLFSNYGGPVESQGVAIARMPFQRRNNPFGAVKKYYGGEWSEPGIGGQITPVFPASVDWKFADADSFWGPSVHWNSYLNKFVMLLNRSCCSPGWPQEGVYVSFNDSLSNPAGWTAPVKILEDVFWYPQVLGRWPDGTDKSAGRVARLYVFGVSNWQVVFEKETDGEMPSEPGGNTSEASGPPFP